jgi:hypothetical protein
MFRLRFPNWEIVNQIKNINSGERNKKKIKALELNFDELKKVFEKFYNTINDSYGEFFVNLFLENNMTETETEKIFKYISLIEVNDKKLSKKIKKFAELFEDDEYKEEDIFDLLKDDFSKNSKIFIDIMKIIKKNSLDIFNEKIPEYARALAIDKPISNQIFEFYNGIDFELNYFTIKSNTENINFEHKLTFLKQCLNIINAENPEVLHNIYEHITDLDKFIQKPINFQQLHKECLEKLANQLRSNHIKNLEISDMIEIDNISTPLLIYDQIINNFKSKYPTIDLFVKLFFDSIKRKESISTHLSNIKREQGELLINQFTLTKYILDNSNPNLKVLFLNACSRFMPIPFLSQTFVNSINDRKESSDHRSRSASQNELANKEDRSVELYPEIFYIINDKVSNVLSFHLSGEPDNYPRGKSKLLNDVFGRSFLIQQSDLTKYRNIEIHFDKHFENPLDLNIADYHGKPDESILNSIIPFFNYYIIHIYKREFEVQMKTIQEFKKKVKNHHSNNFKIIVLIHNPRISTIEKSVTVGNIIEIETMELDKLDQINLEYLKSDLWDILNFSDLLKITDAPLKYLKICDNLKYGKEADFFRNKIKDVDQCIKYIERFKDDYTNPNFLPFNYSFVNYSDYRKKTDKEYQNNNEKNMNIIVSHRMKLLEIYQNQSKYGVIYNFHKIYNDEYFIGNLLCFTQKLKIIVENGLKEPNKKMNSIMTKLSSIKDNELGKKKLEEEKIKIKEEIYKKTFSYEFIVRELYHIWVTSNENKSLKEKEYYLQLQSSLIDTSNPFEIMDGDNLHFISKYYTTYFNNDNSELLVISVIGPQSSGKSTLLNFLFGTQFASSSGRCTKGMYGTLIRIKNHEKYKKLLILDTEGILSAERNDPIFDRKLFLFCLSISNAVIMCVRNELNREMTEIIRLAVSCLTDLKVKKMPIPSVYFVLNALTDINKEALWKPLNKIREDINLENKDMSEILKIDEEHVILLPFAFTRTSVYENLFANIPSLHFSSECLKFRVKLLKNNLHNNIMKLNDWFELAENLWVQIDELRNLIDYSNLEELNQDKLLKEEIRNISNECRMVISSKINIHEICMDATLNFDVNYYSKHLSDGKSILIKIISECYDESYKKYVDYCNKANISYSLNQKRKILLDNNIKLEQMNYEIQLETKINEVKLLKSRLGSSLINEYTGSLLAGRANAPFSLEEATSEFELFWKNENIKNIEKTISKYDDIRDECFKTIYENYSCQTNKLPNNVNLRKDLRDWVINGDIKNIIDKYFRSAEEMLLLKDNLSPNLKEVKDYLHNKSNQNKYLKINVKLFTTDEKINIEEFQLKEGFDYRCFETRINSIYKDIKEKSWINPTSWFYSPKDIEKKLDSLCNEFEKECEALNLKLNFHNKYDCLCYYAHELTEIKKKQEEYGTKQQWIKKVSSHIANLLLGNLSHEVSCRNVKSSKYDFWFVNHLKTYKSFNPNQYDEYIKNNTNRLIISETRTFNSSPNSNLNQNEQNFLRWYEHRDRKRLNNTFIKSGTKLFQNKIDWEALINSICEVVFNSYRRQEYKKPLTFIDFLDKIKKIKSKTDENDDIQEEINEFKNSFNADITMSVVNGVNNIIHFINNIELEPLYFELNQLAIAYLHEMAMILLAELHSVLEFYKKKEPIRANNKDKENFRSYFISILTKDRLSADKSLAQSITTALLDYVYRVSENLATKCYTEGFDNHKSDFEPILLMNKLDEMIENDSIENALECILEPQTKFDLIFKEKWNMIEPKISKYTETKWIDKVSGLLNELATYFESLIQTLQKAKLDSNSLHLFRFQIKNDYDLGGDKFLISEEEKTLCELIGIFFKNSIVGNFDNEMLKIERENYIIFPIKPFPKFDELRNTDIESIIIHQLGDNSSIGNLCLFLDIILKAIEAELNENSFISKFPIRNLDANGNNQKLKQKFIGCTNLCKLCFRKCDEDHSQQGKDLCKCYSGHRFKVFGGSKIERVDFPSFFFCDKMKDDDQLIYGGK